MSDFSLAVIIPNYNHAGFLRQCVESILKQTLQPEEIWIIDDCSTDGSGEVIRELEAESDRVRSVFLEKNGGVSNARNEGLRRTEAAYVTYMDSDDYYYSPDKLEKEMDLVRRWAAKGRDIAAYSETVQAGYDGRVTALPFMLPVMQLKGDIFIDLVARIKLNSIPRDYCIKAEVLKNAGAYSYPEDFYEDLDLLMRLSRCVPFYVTDTYGTAYRASESGLSSRPQEEHDKAVSRIVDLYYNKLTAGQKLEAGVKKLIWNAGIGLYRIARTVMRRT